MMQPKALTVEIVCVVRPGKSEGACHREAAGNLEVSFLALQYKLENDTVIEYTTIT
jgi:hypothetical protein